VYNAKKRLRLIKQLGGECVHCGIIDLEILSFDHIHDDGSVDRDPHRGGNMNHVVAREPHRFQLLCPNCNWRKERRRRQMAMFNAPYITPTTLVDQIKINETMIAQYQAKLVELQNDIATIQALNVQLNIQLKLSDPNLPTE
jgi:hypothetical protein